MAKKTNRELIKLQNKTGMNKQKALEALKNERSQRPDER